MAKEDFPDETEGRGIESVTSISLPNSYYSRKRALGVNWRRVIEEGLDSLERRK